MFAVEKGRTALVVGDLSRKGLAAAQVSTVRNILHAFLYSQPAVGAAVTQMNRVLAENNLLPGFATLFVRIYNSAARALDYVNCGQEPTLLRRCAGSTAEQLAPTGSILGSIENAEYVQETVILASGDAVAIFSDGLTEVGPSRLAMLGIEGVAALFEQPIIGAEALPLEEVAESLAVRLISGIDAAAAEGVMHDDVCLLVAVAE